MYHNIGQNLLFQADYLTTFIYIFNFICLWQSTYVSKFCAIRSCFGQFCWASAMTNGSLFYFYLNCTYVNARPIAESSMCRRLN